MAIANVRLAVNKRATAALKAMPIDGKSKRMRRRKEEEGEEEVEEEVEEEQEEEEKEEEGEGEEEEKGSQCKRSLAPHGTARSQAGKLYTFKNSQWVGGWVFNLQRQARDSDRFMYGLAAVVGIAQIWGRGVVTSKNPIWIESMSCRMLIGSRGGAQ